MRQVHQEEDQHWSSAPMEIVCIDYLSLEPSKGCAENILVITNYLGRPLLQGILQQGQRLGFVCLF